MPTPLKPPAAYIAPYAVAFANTGGDADLVSVANPLPVTVAAAGTGSVPPALTGASSVAALAGPFTPLAARAIMLTLSGTWTGTVRLLRSTDGGAIKLPLTSGGSPWAVFTSNACEAVWEESEAAGQLWLDLAPATGTITYRLGQ